MRHVLTRPSRSPQAQGSFPSTRRDNLPPEHRTARLTLALSECCETSTADLETLSERHVGEPRLVCGLHDGLCAAAMEPLDVRWRNCDECSRLSVRMCGHHDDDCWRKTTAVDTGVAGGVVLS